MLMPLKSMASVELHGVLLNYTCRGHDALDSGWLPHHNGPELVVVQVLGCLGCSLRLRWLHGVYNEFASWGLLNGLSLLIVLRFGCQDDDAAADDDDESAKHWEMADKGSRCHDAQGVALGCFKG